MEGWNVTAALRGACVARTRSGAAGPGGVGPCPSREPAPRDTDGGIDMDALAAGVADRLRQAAQESPDEEVQVFRAKKRRRSSILDSEDEGYDEDDFEDDAPPPPSRRDRRDRPKRRLFGGGS